MLFGVVDLARDKEGVVADGLTRYTRDAVCLFGGGVREAVLRRAPFLVPLPPESPFIAMWRAQGWGLAWGILVVSERSLLDLRKHLRQFLQAALPDGKVVLFRFYDPRILPTYLRSCNREELAQWYSDQITAFRVENGDAPGFLEFTFNGRALEER